MTVDNIKLFSKIPLFTELTPQEIMTVLLAGESMWFGKGDLIIREDTEGDALFVIKSGQVRIAKYDGRGIERDLAILSASEHFGEISLIDNVPRTASVYAYTDCEVLRIPRADFEELLGKHKEIERKFYKAFTKILAERLRKLNDNFTFCQEMGDLLAEDKTEESPKI